MAYLITQDPPINLFDALRARQMTMSAYCYRSGHIVFRNSAPAGAGFILPTPTKEHRDAVRGCARHARDTSGDIFVPGVTEAGDDDGAAYGAVMAFRAWLMQTKIFNPMAIA